MKTFQNSGWRKSPTLGIVCLVSIFFFTQSISALQSYAADTASNSTSDDDCPHCNILREMPMEIAEKINDVSDVDVFVHDFVEDTNSLGNVTANSIHPLRRRRAAPGSFRQATCQLVDTVVSLVPKDERDPTVFYFPSCIIMKQCGGCCAHSGTTCASVDDIERQVTVKKTKYAGGSKLVSLGDIQVTVKEPKKCRCQCKKTASDCNSLQKFVANQCRCECQNTAEAEQCSKQPQKLWDIKSCACVCRDETSCGTGMEFNHDSCSCEAITPEDHLQMNPDEGGEYLDFGQHTENYETFEASDNTKYYHDDTKPE